MKKRRVGDEINFSCIRGMNSTNNDEKQLTLCLVEEILVKLPIKSVLKCKGVCKLWYDLIKSQHFSKYYAKNSGFTRILGYRYGDDKSLYLLETDGVVGGNFIKFPFRATEACFECLDVVATCDGLCCVVGDYRSFTRKFMGYDLSETLTVTIICNPITGEFLELSKGNIKDNYVYGLGFCPSTRRYKVVRFGQKTIDFDPSKEYEVVCQIFTVGVDKYWRDFEDPCFPRDVRKPSIYSNGSVHWFGYDKDSVSIYAFNFEKERGRRFAFVPGFKRFSYGNLTLLDDRLCGVIIPNKVQIDLWVMKEYGVAESWTKHTTLTDSRADLHRKLVTRLKDGRLLFKSKHLFSAYDKKEKKHTRLGESNFRLQVTYVPCFSSIKDDIAEGREEAS